MDASVVSTDLAAPYEVVLDTKRYPDRQPRTLRAGRRYGRSHGQYQRVRFGVEHRIYEGFAVRHNLRNGQVVSGMVDWAADPTGKRVKRVEFAVVDGVTVATDRHEPFALEVDTRKLADGARSFVATAEAFDGSTAGASANVTVANRAQPPASAPAPPAPASFSVTHSVSDGRALSGAVSLDGRACGEDSRAHRVLHRRAARWTERISPYVYAGDGMSLDTKLLSDGAHVLSVKAYSADGSTASISSNVVVSNRVETLELVSSVREAGARSRGVSSG